MTSIALDEPGVARTPKTRFAYGEIEAHRQILSNLVTSSIRQSSLARQVGNFWGPTNSVTSLRSSVGPLHHNEGGLECSRPLMADSGQERPSLPGFPKLECTPDTFVAEDICKLKNLCGDAVLAAIVDPKPRL